MRLSKRVDPRYKANFFLDYRSVKVAILDQRLTQSKISEVLGISRTYLSALINGVLPLPKNGRILNCLAAALRVSPEEILARGAK